MWVAPVLLMAFPECCEDPDEAGESIVLYESNHLCESGADNDGGEGQASKNVRFSSASLSFGEQRVEATGSTLSRGHVSLQWGIYPCCREASDGAARARGKRHRMKRAL